jgi:uncharacterized protein YbjQ (UPF0145 family)
VFSDLAASLSDFFGGFSGTYRNKLELIYNEAKKDLKNKARNIGANAIVGFSVDFDEISGGGKSMFMISASGTACVINDTYTKSEVDKIDAVSQDALDVEVRRLFIIREIGKGSLVKDEWRNFLFEHPQVDIINNLLNLYINLNNYAAVDDGYTGLREFVEKYLTFLPKESVIPPVYDLLLENPERISSLIYASNLFSPTHILDLVENKNIDLSIKLLNVNKDYYSREDLEVMNKILSIYDNLPDTGKIEVVKGGLLSREQEKFICDAGHKSSREKEFCDTCNRNIKGLHKDQVSAIELFRAKIEALSNLLK